MIARELAELMLDGSLNYQLENDAHFVAREYIDLHKRYMALAKRFDEIVEMDMDDFSFVNPEDEQHLSSTAFNDPARL